MRDLDDVVEDYYQKYYESVHGCQWKSRFFSIHAAIENRFQEINSFERCLELGAGNGQHLDFVTHKFEIYIATDIRPIVNLRLLELDEGIIPKENGIYQAFGDATRLLYEDESFDRLQGVYCSTYQTL